MFLRYKNVYLAILVMSSSLVASCDGGKSSTDNPTIDESGDQPSVGQAISGIPDNLASNSAPQINSISMGCDLIFESIAIKIGEITTFTLDVIDESPRNLQYSVSSDDPSLLTTSVDSDGVVKLLGMAEGETTIPVQVIDDAGKQNEILISVIVEA